MTTHGEHNGNNKAVFERLLDHKHPETGLISTLRRRKLDAVKSETAPAGDDSELTHKFRLVCVFSLLFGSSILDMTHSLSRENPTPIVLLNQHLSDEERLDVALDRCSGQSKMAAAGTVSLAIFGRTCLLEQIDRRMSASCWLLVP